MDLSLRGKLDARYARLSDYLGTLPGGLGAYPECMARRGVVEAVLNAAPRFLDPAPPLVAELFTLPRAGWIPEAVFNATMLAMADRAGWSDAELLAWHRSLNRNLFRGPVYRAIMTFLNPLLLIKQGANRWQVFHSGTELEVRAEGERGAVGVLNFPPRLFSPLLLRVYAEAFGAALESARSGRPAVELVEVGESSARFAARW